MRTTFLALCVAIVASAASGETFYGTFTINPAASSQQCCGSPDTGSYYAYPDVVTDPAVLATPVPIAIGLTETLAARRAEAPLQIGTLDVHFGTSTVSASFAQVYTGAPSGSPGMGQPFWIGRAMDFLYYVPYFESGARIYLNGIPAPGEIQISMGNSIIPIALDPNTSYTSISPSLERYNISTFEIHFGAVGLSESGSVVDLFGTITIFQIYSSAEFAFIGTKMAIGNLPLTRLMQRKPLAIGHPSWPRGTRRRLSRLLFPNPPPGR
jgi:hypothetical protein